MILHKITEFFTECFIVFHNITSKFRNIAILKNFIKENNDLNDAARYANDVLLCHTSFI
jgi:hypothetical protein